MPIRASKLGTIFERSPIIRTGINRSGVSVSLLLAVHPLTSRHFLKMRLEILVWHGDVVMVEAQNNIL
jgi:hypothetical protein